MFEREPIFHDRQGVQVTGPITTTSATFVDISGAVLTTKDLGVDGLYLFILSAELEHTNNNSTIDIRVTIDGVPSMSRAVHFGPSSAGNAQSISIPALSIIDAGSVIQAQWETSGSTAQINDIEMVIDGIPENRIIS